MTIREKREMGRRIVALRKRLNLSQTEFAAKVGAAAFTVSRWERGIVYPHPKFCRALDRIESKLDLPLAAKVDRSAAEAAKVVA